MNDLKFRAYIKEYNEMCDVLNIDFVNRCFYVLPYDELEGGNQIEIKDFYLLEQFTGLKDKNGKEAWSNDLRKYNNKIYILINEDWRWALQRNMKDFGENEIIVIDEDVIYESEYIGNKYQNPELLNNN